MSQQEENQTNPADSQESLSQLLQVRRDKLKELQDAGHDPFHITKAEVSHYSAGVKADFDQLEADETLVKLAGRLMSKRGMGKASFCDLQDKEGRIQVYVRQDTVEDPDSFERFKKVDIGDIIAVEGKVFRTQKGELSVRVTKVALLSKSLLPLPEKFHGLTNQELRYRQRYVDLIVNPEVRRTFEVRSKFIRHIRSYLDKRDYMEVETPVLNTISGGASARPFTTHHNTLDLDMYMRIATELHLKRLVVGGLDRVYEIGRLFRNEGMDSKHNPEFTTIELYEAYTNYEGMMEIAEEILSTAAQDILGTYEVTWQGHTISLAPGFRKVTMAEAVKAETGIDFMSFTDDATALAEAKKIGVELAKTDEQTWGNALYQCFDQRVESKLIEPTFITMYPVEVSPLSKKCPTDGRLTERFELFVCGSEMANAFSELNDPIDQKERFQKQVELRDRGDDEAGMMDEDYITALEYGLPPTGGMGMGIDRCVMMLTGTDTIREVIFFPTMRPEV